MMKKYLDTPQCQYVDTLGDVFGHNHGWTHPPPQKSGTQSQQIRTHTYTKLFHFLLIFERKFLTQFIQCYG